MDDPDDTRDLIQRVRARDMDAMHALLMRHREQVRIGIRRMLGQRYRAFADSEDATQDGLLQVLQRIERFEYRGEGSFLAWLLQHTRREVLQKLRTMARQKRPGAPLRSLDSESTPEPVADQATPSEEALAHELEDTVVTCLDRLAPKERDAILLRRYLGSSMQQLQDELGLPSKGAARALLSRATTKLAQLLPDLRPLS